MPRLLELFSGTKSISKAFEEIGWECTTLDINPKADPDICIDIREWNYHDYSPTHFQHVHASPLCTMYSLARTTGGPRDLELADSLVLRTLEIITYFQCTHTLENPGTGLLGGRWFMEDRPFKAVTYCKYGTPYRKLTHFWTDLGVAWQPRPVCCKACPCGQQVDGKHPKTAQRGPTKGGSKEDRCTRDELYHIPHTLCLEIARAAQQSSGL